MSYQTTILYLMLMISTEIKAKPAKDEPKNLPEEIVENVDAFNSTEDTFYFYNTTDDNKDEEKLTETMKSIDTVQELNNQEVSTKFLDKNKCEITNFTFEEPELVETKKLDSVYLNNIYSSVTTNLIEEKVSIDKIEADGVNLYDVVGNECGGAKICPNMRESWKNDKTITIGFLGAYRRSQVRFIYLYFPAFSILLLFYLLIFFTARIYRTSVKRWLGQNVSF